MSNPLAEYLAALESRDVREQAHTYYVNAYTKLADRTAGMLAAQNQAPIPSPSPSLSSKSIPATPKGKAPISQEPPSSPFNIAQFRAELSTTQKHRAELETKLTTLEAENAAMKTTDTEQKKRIAHLERVKDMLERRIKDHTDELKGKGHLVEGVQDEMVALNLQLNMSEQEKDKLKKENEQLTKRLVEKTEELLTLVNNFNERRWEGKKR